MKRKFKGENEQILYLLSYVISMYAGRVTRVVDLVQLIMLLVNHRHDIMSPPNDANEKKGYAMRIRWKGDHGHDVGSIQTNTYRNCVCVCVCVCVCLCGKRRC